MTDAPEHLGDAQGEWYFCMKHRRVEHRDASDDMDRMGPYPTREDAEHWRERVAQRNKEWGEEDS